MTVVLNEEFRIARIRKLPDRPLPTRTVHYVDQLSIASTDHVVRKTLLTLDTAGPPLEAIRYLHARHEDLYLADEKALMPTGGATIAYAIEQMPGKSDVVLIHAALSIVHPEQNFCRATGRSVSRTRLGNPRCYEYLVFSLPWLKSDTAPLTANDRWLQFSVQPDSQLRALLEDSELTPHEFLASNILLHQACMADLSTGAEYNGTDLTELAIEAGLNIDGSLCFDDSELRLSPMAKNVLTRIF